MYRLEGKKISDYSPGSTLEVDQIICTADSICVESEYSIAVLEQLNCVFVETMSRTDYGMYLPGGISCNSNHGEILSLYRRICRYVKENYIKAYNAEYYIGPVLYSTWREHKIEFHFFIDVHSFAIDASICNLEQIVDVFSNNGYIIEENWHDIRKNKLDLTGNVFVIFDAEAKKHIKLISRKVFYYPDSECVFLWKEKRKKEFYWRFVIDARHFYCQDERDKQSGNKSVSRLWDSCLLFQRAYMNN